MKEQYRSFRVYLHTSLHPYEDGYNLALLEAMATGMPIATLSHPTSPIEDGVHGVVAADGPAPRRQVIRLLEDAAESVRTGNAARDKLEREFRFADFQAAWAGLASRLLGSPRNSGSG